jgi:phage terminase large subunit-like protein
MPKRKEVDKDVLPIPMQYAYDVLEGRVLACKYVKLAVQRHLNDLKEGHKRGLYFDEAAGHHIINFFQFLKHSKGKFAGKAFELEPYQQFTLWVLFGWKNADGTRRFKYAYNEVARKNGKSTLSSGVALYMLLGDGESGAEVYTAATMRDQAKICFDEAKKMVQKSPALKSRISVYQHNMHILANNSKMEPLSSDADSLDGLNPHCSIVDEYHAHRNAELYNVLKSAMGAREQPLQFTITTAGFNKEGPCYQLRKTCIEILEGKKHDDTLFAIIFTLDEDDDWTDEKVWIKANPNLGNSISLKYLRDECNSAKNNASEEVNFKTKNLNIWTDASTTWIADEKWKACNKPVDMEGLEGKECFGGLDLASVVDVASLVLFFPQEDGTFDLLPYFWIPEDTAAERTRKDGVGYLQWIKEGFIRTTPGNVIDFNFIKEDIRQLCEQYQVKRLGFDRWNSSQLVNDLTEEGINLTPFGQGFKDMAAPTKELERLVYAKLIRHNQNPVLRWMLGNVEIKRDPAGNIKPDKQKSSEKIDGIVATIMAIGEYMTDQANGAGPSVYEERGIRTL